MIVMHSYYAQPIYYTYVYYYCEPLTDWGMPLITLYTVGKPRQFEPQELYDQWCW